MSRSPCLPARHALALLTAVLLTPGAAAQSVRLSGDLARLGTGDVLDVRFSTDGTRLVYRADQDADEVFELYSVPADGSAAPVVLSGPLASGGDVQSGFVPVGDRVLFLADAGVDGKIELFSVPVDGSAPRTALSGSIVSGGRVFDFRVAPDGEQVVFTASALQAGRTSVFRAPVDGSQPRVRLDVDDFFSSSVVGITPDSAQVLLGSTTSAVLRVPIDGSSAPTLLAVPTCSGAFCFTIPTRAHVSPDGSWVFCQVAVVDDELCPTLLFGFPLDGSQPPTLLSLDDGAHTVTTAVPSPDSQGVFFLEEFFQLGDLIEARRDGTRLQRNPPGTQTHAFALSTDGNWLVFDGSGSLYRTPLDGSGAPVVLAGPGVQPELAISADGTTVLYVGVDGGTGFRGLFSVALDGSGSPVLLNGPALSEPLGLVVDDPFALAQGFTQERVVFREQRGVVRGIELRSAPIDGSAASVSLTGPLPAPSDVTRFVVSPDGTRAAHVADARLDETFELFSGPADGATPAEVVSAITPDGPVAGDVGDFLVLPTVNRALYLSMEASATITDLYTVRLDARGVARSLTEALGLSGNVQRMLATPDGTRAVFAYDPSGVGPDQLFAVPTDASADPALLDTSTATFLGDHVVVDGGTRLLYRGGSTSGIYQLRSVPLDASAPALVVHPPGVAFSTVYDFAVAPDGLRVVYHADHDVRNVRELWSGSALGGPVVKLSGPMVLSGDVLDFAISPDGAWVVYLADQLLDGQDELFRAPIDGSAPARRISGAMPPGRDVVDFRFSGEGHVVFRSDQAVNDRDDLFVVPVQGPRPALGRPGGERWVEPRLLTGTETTPIQPDYAVTPDGRAVLYRAGPTAGRSLYRVALDGRTPPQRLNGPLVNGGNVHDFAIAPGAGLVVYRADEIVNNTVELFTVPLGGGPSTRIVALTSPDDVEAFRVAPGEAEVFLIVRPLGIGVDDLYRVPLDGSALPRRVNRPLPVGGDVLEFEPLADGRVVYRADEIVDERFELFLGLVPQEPVRPAATPTRFVVR